MSADPLGLLKNAEKRLAIQRLAGEALPEFGKYAAGERTELCEAGGGKGKPTAGAGQRVLQDALK